MATKQQSIYRLSFDGHILRRGFWLYVWRITSSRRTVLYVGRTGDSSFDFASSPFVPIGRHLDLRPNAKSNSLARRLGEESLNPTECGFEFVAFGRSSPSSRAASSTAVSATAQARLRRHSPTSFVLAVRGYRHTHFAC